MNDQIKRAMDQMGQRIVRLEQAVTMLHLRGVRADQRRCELDAAFRLTQAGKKAHMPVEFRSQFGEDVFIWNLFGGKLDGFFIEVGAHDGYQLAVTYALEAVGWTGLLVEPIPEAFTACQKRRPRSRVVHAALSRPGSGPTANFAVTTDELFSRLAHVPGQLQTGPGWTERTVVVPQTTMDALLVDHEGPIDVAVIDVEGGEMDLLAGFDLRKHQPRVLLIEDGTMTNRALVDHVGQSGYRQMGVIEVNHIFIHEDERALLARCAEI
jgi:FkbM family methyltransferase